MASLDDVLTISKNIVTAINNASQTYLNVNGVRSSVAVTTETLIVQGSARVARVIVTVAGSTSGTLYDASSITGATTTSINAIIPAAVGVYEFNIPVINGIVVKPGTGMTLTVVYS